MFFYITYKALQIVSVFFIISEVSFMVRKGCISKTFHCKSMLSSESIYNIFYTNVMTVYINNCIIRQFSKYGSNCL